MNWNGILNWIKWIMIWNECGFEKIWYFGVLKWFEMWFWKDMIFWYIKMIWKEVLKGYDNLIYWNG